MLLRMHGTYVIMSPRSEAPDLDRRGQATRQLQRMKMASVPCQCSIASIRSIRQPVCTPLMLMLLPGAGALASALLQQRGMPVQNSADCAEVNLNMWGKLWYGARSFAQSTSHDTDKTTHPYKAEVVAVLTPAGR
jgi:hypothetical protein